MLETHKADRQSQQFVIIGRSVFRILRLSSCIKKNKRKLAAYLFLNFYSDSLG